MKRLLIIVPLILAASAARADFQAHSVRKDSLHAGRVSRLIASSVSARIGARWVRVALQIAKIESGGRCNAANRSGAVGVFQVLHPQEFGISRAAALTCSGGVAAGVAHMARCVAHGARTEAQMLACHNGGSPFARRLEPAYRRALARL